MMPDRSSPALILGKFFLGCPYLREWDLDARVQSKTDLTYCITGITKVQHAFIGLTHLNIIRRTVNGNLIYQSLRSYSHSKFITTTRAMPGLSKLWIDLSP